MQPEEAKEAADFHQENKRLADAEIPGLEERLEGMTLKEAIETEEDDPESILQDLDSVSLEGVRTVRDKQVERLLFDAMAGYAGRAESGLKDDQRAALNNYVQLRNTDGMIVERAGLMLAEPSPDFDPRVQELRQRVIEKQAGLLREALGVELAGMVDELEAHVIDGWRSEEWQRELEAAIAGIGPSPQNDPHRFLDAVEHIGSMRFGADTPVDLGRVRNIKDARKEFGAGDPAAVAHQGNPFLRSAAEIARQGREEVSVKRAAETLRFLEEKIQQKLARMGLKSV